MKKIGLMIAALLIFALTSTALAAQVRATGSVNVRSGPGLGYDIIETVFEGNSLEYTGQTEYDDRGVAWYSVDCYGQAGWMSEKYSELERETSDGKNAHNPDSTDAHVDNTPGFIELIDYMGKNGEWAADALRLHYQKDCYMDNANSINLYDEYGGGIVSMIGIFQNNSRHCIEGVHPGMGFSEANAILCSKGYEVYEGENSGFTVYTYNKDAYSIDIIGDGEIITTVYIDSLAHGTNQDVGEQSAVNELPSSGIELSGYYGENIHDTAAVIGGLSYEETDGEDGIKDVYENGILSLYGWDTISSIRLYGRSDYMLNGIKVGMNRNSIREKMNGYLNAWGDEDDEYGAEYIIKGNKDSYEILLYVAYDDAGYAREVEYGIWS